MYLFVCLKKKHYLCRAKVLIWRYIAVQARNAGFVVQWIEQPSPKGQIWVRFSAELRQWRGYSSEFSRHCFKPKSVIRFHIVLFLSPLYCNHFVEGIAGYVETEREARQRRERRNERKDHITITELLLSAKTLSVKTRKGWFHFADSAQIVTFAFTTKLQ